MPSRLPAICLLLAVPTLAYAAEGRILATGGATQIEGASGGGLVPWASIVGYSAPGQVDADLSLAVVRTGDFDLAVAALGVGIGDRLELSLARQRLSLDGPALDPPITLDIIGAKLKLAGNLIYGARPQWSLGLQYKQQRDFALPQQLGVRSASDVDVYLAASRLLLDGPFHRNWLLNATLRSSAAHQTGLLGFGPARHWLPEFSVAMFANPRWAVGAEYRFKPDALSGIREDDWWDGFVGWFPNKHFSAVMGYASLGSIARLDRQDGAYVNFKWNP